MHLKARLKRFGRMKLIRFPCVCSLLIPAKCHGLLDDRLERSRKTESQLRKSLLPIPRLAWCSRDIEPLLPALKAKYGLTPREIQEWPRVDRAMCCQESRQESLRKSDICT